MRPWLFGGAVSLAVVGFLVALTLQHEVPDPGQLASCFTAGSEPEVITCAQPLVKALLAEIDPADLLKSFSETASPPRCHFVGHIVGQELFYEERTVDAALARCPDTCASSCVHGVIGAAFTAVPGITDSIALAHPDLGLIRDEGRRLCINREACHGLGHILFQLFGTFEGSLAVCKDLAAGKEPWSCYRGVFMENNSALSSHNTILGERMQRYRGDDLLYPCITVDEEYAPACYHFLFLSQDILFTERGITDYRERRAQRIDACMRLDPSHLRDACFEGVGWASYRTGPTAEVRDVCLRLPQETERAACMFGLSHGYGDFGDETGALELCAAVSAPTHRECYQALFDSVRNRAPDRLAAVCARAKDPRCAEELRTFSDGSAAVTVPR